MAIGPLFVKYQTRAGNCYVYDPRTNEVIRVEEAIYQILDDYHVLDQDEIIAKNQANGEAVVRMALAQLDALQSSGILCDHPPQLTRRAEWIRCQGTTESLDEFLRHRRRLLTLELTQQCNLRCDYCCFGEHYPQTRRPSTSPMSFETARKAVTAFINHRPKRAGIGFYGGEPLLEFDLLKQIVLFAEEQAGQFATSVGFSITTNGTLLTDEKIHFLAQHEFSVLVSLDGDKKSHDRYRIFRNQNRPEKRIGSFDTVIKNMTRFVELYPEYLGRGIAVTLTATSDFQAIEQFVSKWEPSYPTIMANFVQAVPDDPRAGCGDRCIQLGRLRTVPCANGSCGRERLPEVDEDNYCAASVGLLGGNDGPAETPAFCNWTRDSVHRLQSNHDCFMASVRCVKDSSDANVLRSKFPLGCSQLDRSFRSVHFRQVSGNRNSEQYVFRLSCFPGATRTYCSSQGFLFSCERTEWGSLLELGSAANDFDVDVRKAHELTELVRLLCDCGNCVANRLCSHCPALVSESREHPGTVDGLAFQEECRQTQAALPGKLKAYTELMEVNPEILDVLLSGTTVDDDWLNDVKVIVPRRKAVEELVAEEIEEIV